MRITTIAALAALTLAPAGAGAQQPGNWYPSKYGADDQIGAMNLLTPQKVLEAARLVQRGQVYRLGVPVGRDTPAYPPRFAAVTVMMPDQTTRCIQRWRTMRTRKNTVSTGRLAGRSGRVGGR